jgi:hypothetical protein
MYKYESISRYVLNEVETCHHLISIRLYFILTILITEDDHNHIFLAIATQLVFFITYNKMKNIYHTVGTVPTIIRKILEIISFSVRRLLSITFHINI